MKSKGNIQDIYPLTPMQEGMLYQSLVDPTSSAYFEQTGFRLTGQLDIRTVKKTLDYLFTRHDILRTAFVHEGLERPMQVVLKNRKSVFSYRDIRRQESFKAKEDFIRHFREKDRQRTFNLARDILMRVSVIRIDTNLWEFIWSHHHILIDGWCTGLLILEFFEIYRCFQENTVPQLPQVIPYRDYVLWLEKQDKKVSQEYWADYLKDYTEPANFSVLKKPEPHEEGFKNKLMTITLTEEETDSLMKIAARNQVTLNNLIQTGWGILLGKYNNKQDVVFGVVVSGRPSEIHGVESIIGLFINTIPFRFQYHDDTILKEALRKVREHAVQGEPHHYFPLARIQSQHIMKQNLLDHFVAFMNLPIAERLDGFQPMGKQKGSEMVLSKIDHFQQTHYSLDLAVSPGKKMILGFEYNANIYDPQIIEQMGSHFKHLLMQMAADDTQLIARLMLITEKERQQFLEEINNVVEEYQRDKVIHQYVEDQVGKTPENMAVFYEGQQLTYRKTNEQANQLARQLRDIGVGPERVVGILLERSTNMAVSMLAVLKAGGAFLPIDPDAPVARNELMLEENDPMVILSHHGLYRPEKAAVLYMDDEKIYTGERSNLENINQPENLAFVLYTSGTTGKPKGILLEHRNANHYIHGLNRRIFSRYEGLLNIGLQAPFTFDGFAQMLLGGMWYGYAIYILPNEIRSNGAALLTYFKEHHIHITDGAPAHIRLMVESSQEHSLEMELKNLIIAGEVLPHKIAVAFLNRFRGRPPELTNAYGPTECCGDSTMFHVTPENVNLYATLPIGTPMPNELVYIVDKFNQLQPSGIWGEVCIGGEGVARGYLKREELTAKKFIPSPFKEDGRLYRTGDLARWIPDAAVNAIPGSHLIEFLGRTDQQVKVRGYRIEPEEVRQQMLYYEDITDAVVVAREDGSGDNYLCAYYVAGKQLNAGQLRLHLAKYLPSYMIPAYFISLDKIPLTPRGKVDLKALPDSKEGFVTGKTYEPPANDAENKIVTVWSEVLGIDRHKISVYDDYYELGGNSINILNVLNRLNKEFGHTISLGSLILYPTPRELASNIHEQGILNKLECIVKLNKGGNKKNIFIIHPMNGQVYIYKDLAKLLEGHYNMYGIQARGIVRRSKLAQSIPEMVDDYIYQLRAVQPEGPYLIMGHCIGDVIAFRMVKRLEEMKCPVERLIMTDEGAWTLELVLNHIRRKERLRSLFKPFITIGKLFKKKELFSSPYAEYDAVYKGEPEITPEEAEQMKNKVHYHIQKLNRLYFRQNVFKIVEGIIKTPILDIKAKDTEERIEAEVVSKLTFGSFTMVESDGGHFTMFQKPHVFRLAEIMKNKEYL